MSGRILGKLSTSSPDFRRFLVALCLWGFSGSIIDSVFNNYLSETFRISDLMRTMLEVPRELPGFSVIFVSALLFFLCSRRLGALAMSLCAAGLVLIVVAAPSVPVVLVWLFVFSLGQHLFLPLNQSIGMELAREGEAGKRLGQFNGARNVAAIAGSFVVFVGFRNLHMGFSAAFLIAATGFAVAAALLYRMAPSLPQSPGMHLKLYRQYALYYWLSILYGTRKQIFLTFAPWVLVTVFRQPTAMVASLLTIGGIIGIVFQPLLGGAIDKWGERTILAAEAAVLVVCCLGYGFSRSLFPGNWAFYVAAACYVCDQLLMSVGMARATYLKKIALDPAHVTPTLTMAVSIDHVFSISTALLSGLLWQRFGYQAVFLAAAGIAVVNFFSALRIRIPARAA